MANEDFSAGIDRLFALVTDDMHQQVEPANTAAVTGWGAVFNAIHLTRGIKTLHDAGCCASAPPLLRSLLEYTMGMLWLADAGDAAVEVLAHGMFFTHTKLDKALRMPENAEWRGRLPREGVEKFEQVLAEDLEKHPDEYLLIFTRLLEEYGFPQWVPVYNTLSMFSHFSSVGAQRYFRQTGTAWEVSQVPIADEVMPCLYVSLGLLLDAMAAFDTLMLGQPWKVGLEQIAAEYEFTITRATRKTKGRPN